jgi:peroxiredoxin
VIEVLVLFLFDFLARGLEDTSRHCPIAVAEASRGMRLAPAIDHVAQAPEQGRMTAGPAQGRRELLANREGQRVPDVIFRTRADGDWIDLSTHDLFAGKTVVVFSLPGAFTPTCSAAHLPGYEALADEIRAHGVDDILCISVNDAFVMNAWAKEQGCSKVRVIPDGNGAFTEAMGMLVDKSDLGFGKRSWRYSMLVRDGVIEKMFIERKVPGDPYEVSDANTMLHHLESRET